MTFRWGAAIWGLEENQHGVKMVLTAFGDLVELRAADKGVMVTLKEERKKAR